MGFHNVQQGDAPYLKSLADKYAMSDNYPQAASGGTGMNHVEIGSGDAIWFSNGNSEPTTPPHNTLVAAGTVNAGTVVENPNAAPGTNNWYEGDGYGSGSSGSASSGGGSYSNCSDSDAPSVTSVLDYLSSLPYEVDPKCAAGHYYQLNNYIPGYFGNGANAYTDTNARNTVFTRSTFDERFVYVLRRPVEHLQDRPIFSEPRRCLLQHLQLSSVHNLDHDQPGGTRRAHQRHRRSVCRDQGDRSRDNLPNPKASKNPYIPSNSPAIGDLWDLFDFGS